MIDTLPPSTETAAPMQLIGAGYELIVPDSAAAVKKELIDVSSAIVTVTTPEESNLAQFEIRRLAALRIQVESTRVTVKAPVIELGKQIDAVAKDFIALVISEEDRLKKLVGNHAEQVRRDRLAAEAEERRKFEEAKRAKEEAERAAREAEEAKQAAADEAEAARKEAMTERLSASALVSETRVSVGVKFVTDFEVTDIAALYAAAPHLVTLTPKAAEIKKAIAENKEIPGLRIFERPAVSTR